MLGFRSGQYIDGYNDNIFLGPFSGQFSTGNDSICMGSFAGQNKNGDDNLYIGNHAARNSNGNVNIAIGSFAGINNTGNRNIFIGSQCGSFNNANDNMFIGTLAGRNNTTGSNNMFLGSDSGYNNTTGSSNIFFGYQSGFTNTNGINNTLIGYKSGYNNTSNTNTYIGNLVGQLNNGNNNFFLGYELVDTTGGLQTTYSNKFAIYQNSNSGITSNTSGTCNILIGGDFSTGTVGIGTIVPDYFSSGSFSTTATKFVVDGSILANAYNSFTGCHIIELIPDISPIVGMIMSSTGNCTIYSILNTIPQTNISNVMNDKAVFGIYSGSEIKNNQTLHYVASIGEGCILVSNITGEIQNGDYITSSTIPGYGCLQADDLMHSYTVAKCTQNINWDDITENILCPEDGKMYKSIMVACTYHCG
jgi:hypothetical protein